MRVLPIAAALAIATALGCNASSPTSTQIRQDTSVATETVADDVEGAAEGVRDGLHKARGGAGYNVVNINTAPELTLMTLPDLTAIQARQIIRHRPYALTTDLRNRHIIPSSEFDEIKPRIITAN